MPDAITDSQRLQAQLRYPCGDVPDSGVIKNVAPGIYWLRMPLPFQLNHINLWLIEEADGWTIVDTGINTDATRELWEKIFAEQLRGKPVIRVVATHLHPDHVGLAGWLCERWKAPLLMTLGEYMSAIAARNDFIENEDLGAAHLLRNGVPADSIPLFHRHKGGYAKGVAPLPPAFQRMIHAHPITLGGHRWDVDRRPRPCAGACLAVVPRAQRADRRRPGAAQDQHQCRRVAERAHRRRADLVPRRLLALPPPAGRCAGAAEPRLSLRRHAHAARPAGGPSRRPAERDHRGDRPHRHPGRRPAGTW